MPVSKSDAWDYAASIGAKYIETSSRTNVRHIISFYCCRCIIIDIIDIHLAERSQGRVRHSNMGRNDDGQAATQATIMETSMLLCMNIRSKLEWSYRIRLQSAGPPLRQDRNGFWRNSLFDRMLVIILRRGIRFLARWISEARYDIHIKAYFLVWMDYVLIMIETNTVKYAIISLLSLLILLFICSHDVRPHHMSYHNNHMLVLYNYYYYCIQTPKIFIS